MARARKLLCIHSLNRGDYMTKVKWGFIGTGRIIPRFMDGFCQVQNAEAAAIYGRNKDKAQQLANRFDIPLVYNNFDDFLQESDIDVAYVAVNNTMHSEFVKKCLQAKIPVVCEKPMSTTAESAKEMVDCARANSTFLMEGLWTNMFPVTRQIQRWIEEGRIGKLVAMNASFSIKTFPQPGDRLFDPEQAGGALLDIGVYLVAYAHTIFGRSPQEIASLAHIGDHGVDECSGTVFRYDGGEIATLFASFNSEGRDRATIYGEEGIIEIEEDFWRPRHAKLTCRDGYVSFDCPEPIQTKAVYDSGVSFRGEGYQFEIQHVNQCIIENRKESPLVPLDKSVSILETCDELRKKWNLAFPFEK